MKCQQSLGDEPITIEMAQAIGDSKIDVLIANFFMDVERSIAKKYESIKIGNLPESHTSDIIFLTSYKLVL